MTLTSLDPTAQRHQHQVQLQQYLDTDSDTATKDLNFVLRQAQSSDARSQSAMYWVLQSPRFKYWVQSLDADVLAVNGNLEDGTARYSAMSLLSGILIQSLGQQQSARVLQFFCGAHSARNDPIGGPSGMIRSLVAQLLSLQPLDVGFLDSVYWKEGLQTQNPVTLGRLFHRLLEQLSDVVVFCIIDSISVFETDRWATELQSVLQALLDAVADRQLRLRFKLLVTSTSRNRCLSGIIDERNILNVPADMGTARPMTDRLVELEMSRDGKERIPSARYDASFEDVYSQGYD